MEILSEQLRAAREALKGCKGKEAMLSIICEATHKPGILYPNKDHRFSYFNYKMGGHSYRGYIYNPFRMTWQGDLYGTIFYFWDNTPYIVRGYPKILYAQVRAANIMGRYVRAEEKVDGTNLIFWNFPNDQLMGKTRAVPRYDTGGYQGRMWNELAGNTGRLNGIRKLTKDDYNPAVELYGYLNQCDYIDYPDTPIDIKGLDIIDNRTFSFVPYKKKKELFEDADIPMPSLHWEGTLDQNNLTYLENEAESLMGGYEGFMVKYWSELYQDQFFGKIKCHAMRELARLRSGGALPIKEIDRAIRKALDSIIMISSVSELHSMVIEELYSDNEKHYVDASLVRIERTIAKAFPIDTIAIWSQLDRLDDTMDITEDNKGQVLGTLSITSDEFSKNPNRGYRAFILWLKKNGRM